VTRKRGSGNRKVCGRCERGGYEVNKWVASLFRRLGGERGPPKKWGSQKFGPRGRGIRPEAESRNAAQQHPLVLKLKLKYLGRKRRKPKNPLIFSQEVSQNGGRGERF